MFGPQVFLHVGSELGVGVLEHGKALRRVFQESQAEVQQCLLLPILNLQE